MWTKNEYGQPFCWVDPSHKISVHDEDIGKYAREALAERILEWFPSVVDHLAADNWAFAVNKKGEYLPGTPTRPAPEPFENNLNGWALTLRALSRRTRSPRTQGELTDARETIHKVVTIVLMNLIGSAMAGKRLAPYRAIHQLPKLRKSDILGKQSLLF